MYLADKYIVVRCVVCVCGGGGGGRPNSSGDGKVL